MIRDDIKAATIAAMKGGDKETTGTLRLVSAAINGIVAETGASSMKDMGRVMALVKERLGGSIEPARASTLVKSALS